MRQFCIGTGTFKACGRAAVAALAALSALSGCGTVSNLESTRNRVAATRYEIGVKSVLGLLSSPQAVEKAWAAEATKACGGKPWDAITKEYIDELKTGMKGLVECRQP